MKTLNYFADYLLGRIRKNFDNVIIVDSGSYKGSGKSTFSIELAKKICEKIGYNYSYDLIIFNPTSEKIVDKVKTLPEGCPIHIDETSRVAYKRDFQKEFSKNLIKFINICRKFKKIVIFDNPDFWDLDKDLRNLADFRVMIMKRGMAQVRGKYANPEVEDKWLRKMSMEIIDENIKSDPTNIDTVIIAVRKTSNYLFDIPFDELPLDEYDKYEELSKVEELKGMEKINDINEVRLGACIVALSSDGFNLNTQGGKLKSQQIAEKINDILTNYIISNGIVDGRPYKFKARNIREICNNFKAFGGKPVGNTTKLHNNNNTIKGKETAETPPIYK